MNIQTLNTSRERKHFLKPVSLRGMNGFTLIELAIVVFLIGLLTTIGISALKAQLVSASTDATKKKEDVIKYALISYLAKNKRLPCPAVDNLGKDGRSGTNPNCTTYWGLVPYYELGLPMSAAMDGWENFFSYAVSPQWTVTYQSGLASPTSTASGTPSVSFNVGNSGSMSVWNRIPASQANPGTLITNSAVVVLISSGVNGLGSYTIKGTQNVAPATGTDESSNALPESALPLTTNITIPTVGFFQREYTELNLGAGAYDDILAWYSPNDLLSVLIQDGALQSAYGQYSNQVSNIKSAVIGNILTSGCTIPSGSNTGVPISLSVDPWGNTLAVSGVTSSPFLIQYNILTPLLHCGASAVNPATSIYTLSNSTANQLINGPSCLDFQYLQNSCNP